MAQPDMIAQLAGAQGTWQGRWLALMWHALASGTVGLGFGADTVDVTEDVFA